MGYLPSGAVHALVFYFLSLTVLSAGDGPPAARDIFPGDQVLQVFPPLLDKHSASTTAIACERVRVVGHSRMKLSSYSNSFLVSVNASDEMPERHYKRIEICFHRNASVALCQCEKEEWRNLHSGKWTSSMSPYENKYIDVKFVNGISGFVSVSADEEIQHWRFVCFGIGFLLLLLAPIVSKWAPFYYSSSMALGVLLVVLILLFQGMKLLPAGRKNILYLTIYGSVLGVGSLLVHYFSMLTNSILVNFGISEDLHNPVSVFLLLGIILSGAALGYWIVRKFVITEDGSVDTGIAQFVKWAMRIIAIVFISQSTLDSGLAVTAIIICWNICSLVTPSKWMQFTSLSLDNSTKVNLWKHKSRQTNAGHMHAEFLSRSGTSGLQKPTWRNLCSPYSRSSSPTKGLVLASPRKTAVLQQDYYSTFHRAPVRKFSKKEWDEITRETTKDALAEWASTPEVSNWLAENAHRILLRPNEDDEDSIESSSDSSEETVVESSPGFFRWL